VIARIQSSAITVVTEQLKRLTRLSTTLEFDADERSLVVLFNLFAILCIED